MTDAGRQREGTSGPSVPVLLAVAAVALSSLFKIQGFDIWWHDGHGVAYANGIGAAECST